MAIKITFSDDDLLGMQEPELLRKAIAVYQLQHTHENGKDAISGAIGVSGPMIDKALQGCGHLGSQAWIRIDRLLGMPLHGTWYRLFEERS